MKIRLLYFFKLTLALLLFVQVEEVSAQCAGTWSGGTILDNGCIHTYDNPIYIGQGTPISSCTSTPVFTANQSATFTFPSSVSKFSINFNAFSSIPDCSKLELKINGVHYNLTNANLISNSCNPAGLANVTTDANGYITGSSSSLQNASGEATIVITGVNANTITVSTNDANGTIFSAPFTCSSCNAGTVAPVPSVTSKATVCPATTVGLPSTSAAPSTTTVKWFTNNAHTGTAVADATQVPAGTYYAFYYDATNNCYSPASVAVTVTATPCCNAGTTAPVPTVTTIANVCPATTVSLPTTSAAPSTTTVKWFTNNAHTGTAVADATQAPAGTYYAFYYDATNNCYSPASAAVTATVSACCPTTAPTVN